MKIVEALAGLVNDRKFNLGNHCYTLHHANGKGTSGFIKLTLIHSEISVNCRWLLYAILMA